MSITTDMEKIKHRGPDTSTSLHLDETLVLGFHRLAIRDVSYHGEQPFQIMTDSSIITWICNGELYSYDILKKEFGTVLKGHSDCEIIGHMYVKYGIEKTCQMLDGEFAFVLIDQDIFSGTKTLYIARDPFGVRPLFYGVSSDSISFASEMKSIISMETVLPFPPGTIMQYTGKTQHQRCYYEYPFHVTSTQSSLPILTEQIRSSFTQAVKKRLIADRPLACLLSGGLDSSLVCAVAATCTDHPITTFTIGMKGGTDLGPAREVANYIGSDHHEIIIDKQEALAVIDKVVYSIESWDTTTVRASVFQYLIGQYIRQETSYKVLLTGEGSDELTGGYLYFHKAPSAVAFHDECVRLLQDIYLFDGLRVDRAMSAHGLEVRIPFLDWDFVKTYVSIPASLRMPKDGIEKRLLRTSFVGMLPDSVLRRRKEAFSDGVSTTEDSWYALIQDMAESAVSDIEFTERMTDYPAHTPQTKEQLLYRRLFEKHFGKKHVGIIPYYRMPKWVGMSEDPSARVLELYS